MRTGLQVLTSKPNVIVRPINDLRAEGESVRDTRLMRASQERSKQSRLLITNLIRKQCLLVRIKLAGLLRRQAFASS